MVVIVIIFSLVLLIGWISLSPLEVCVDSREPLAMIRWISIGRLAVVYENDQWLIRCRVLFFSREWNLETLILRPGKKQQQKRHKKRRAKKKISGRKILAVLKTFRVLNWELAVDAGDYTMNSWLYPLNFISPMKGHLDINFTDENYFFLRIRNAPWKLMYAFLK